MNRIALNFEALKGAAIRRAASDEKIEGIVDKLQSLSNGRNFVQVFDPDAVINRVHLESAYLNALMAFREGTNIAKSVQMEMLLFVAMTKQVKDAIALAGAKTPKDMIIFATSAKLYEAAKHHFKREGEAVFTKLWERKAAYKYGIKNTSDLDSAILNAMSFSRIDL